MQAAEAFEKVRIHIGVVFSIATKIVPAGPVRGILQGGHQVFSTILMYTEKRPGPGTRNNLSCNRE